MSVIPADSLSARAARNFFSHSGHVPLVLLILEALLAPSDYFSGPDPYLLLGAGVLQAIVMEWPAVREQRGLFLANFVGPLLYSVVEAGIEGPAFFRQWHHLAYWGFASGFAALHWAQSRRPAATVFVLAESVFRSAIPLVMYALFEARTSYEQLTFDDFLGDPAHRFLAIVLLLLGVLLGFAEANLRRSLATVRTLTERLHRFSAWSLGRTILDRAIVDERSLSLQRVDRAVLFVDIRGFTAWSETRAPETVAAVLNSYYGTAERALDRIEPIKLKYTADEIMAVFASAAEAVKAGRLILTATAPLLTDATLSAGAGVHFGPVVEGVLGGEGAKAYDFIGDTVNTAKRLCESAAPGELLVSLPACAAAGIGLAEERAVPAKGKREPVRATIVR